MNDNNRDKESNKERLQKQAERPISDITEDKRWKDGHNEDISLDPAQKIAQTGSTTVQNPQRNLAKGGNNTNAKHRSG
ncbi:hypothetical protein GCM10027443_20870 [Pontibacter brevis]